MDYTAKDISVLEGLEAVRKRPGMYVGDTTKAVKQMVFEVIDNCIDEHSMGHCKNIFFEFKNGIFKIRDDGRGIPVDMHETGKPAVEVILTTLHSGGKFGNGSYKYSGGLHGVGVSVVNALSKVFEVEVYRNNKIYYMKFHDGIPVTQLEEHGQTDLQGTQITFQPDLDLIDSEMPTSEEISARLEELSYLNNGLKIDYHFEQENKEFYSLGGIQDLAGKMGKSIIEKSLHFKTEQVEVCFFWDENDADDVLCFTNNIFQIDGGTHLFGFRGALAKVLMSYAEKEVAAGRSKVKKVLPEDIRGGLKGVVSVKISEPRFSSQTKTKLVSAEAKPLVENFLTGVFGEFIEQNPKERERIIKRILFSANLRETISKSKDSVKKAHIDAFSILPGKLSDCQSENPAESELYLVEGDSAGGSCKGGRNRKYQAILSLRGKPLNVERAHINRALSCDSIITIIAALGTGVASTFNPDKLRYHKIIIMTDADVDGLHIRCLLITLFLKLMPEIVERQHVYVARTPLYKVSHGRSSKYIQDEDGLQSYLFERFAESHSIETNNKKRLTLDEIKKFVDDCNDFKKFIGQKALTVDSRILSFALCYNVFKTPEVFLKNITNVIEGECSLENVSDGLTLYVNSLYGKSEYYLKNYGVDWSMHAFPILLDDEKIYEPLEFLKVFQKKINSGLIIQRYKGLGEMNPEELAETSLHPDLRVLEPLVVTSVEEAITHMKIIMGNENDRREFVLGHIKEVFGIYLD